MNLPKTIPQDLSELLQVMATDFPTIAARWPCVPLSASRTAENPRQFALYIAARRMPGTPSSVDET